MHLKAIIFDWAGTVVDFGCLCPVQAFLAAFAEQGIVLSAAEVHQFMGIHKRDHICALLSLPKVAAAWLALHGQKPGERDINSLYEMAERRMLETVADSAVLIPGAEKAVASVRQRGLKIGSTTGYTSPLMERLVPAAAARGYNPDFWIASDQVPQGRPWPWMIFKNMEQLKVCPPAAVIKIGDTVSDVEEAHNAGVWSVAVVESSSVVGRSEAEVAALSPHDRRQIMQRAEEKFATAGAHFIIRNLSELSSTIEQIETLLEKGQAPSRPSLRPVPPVHQPAVLTLEPAV